MLCLVTNDFRRSRTAAMKQPSFSNNRSYLGPNTAFQSPLRRHPYWSWNLNLRCQHVSFYLYLQFLNYLYCRQVHDCERYHRSDGYAHAHELVTAHQRSPWLRPPHLMTSLLFLNVINFAAIVLETTGQAEEVCDTRAEDKVYEWKLCQFERRSIAWAVALLF